MTVSPHEPSAQPPDKDPLEISPMRYIAGPKSPGLEHITGYKDQRPLDRESHPDPKGLSAPAPASSSAVKSLMTPKPPPVPTAPAAKDSGKPKETGTSKPGS